MKRSPFAVISLIAGMLVFIPAVLIAIADGLQLSESHPFVAFAFPIIAIFSLPEAPAQMLPFSPGLPVILPLIGVATGIMSMIKNEPARRMALTGIVVTIASIAIHIAIRMLTA